MSSSIESPEHRQQRLSMVTPSIHDTREPTYLYTMAARGAVVIMHVVLRDPIQPRAIEVINIPTDKYLHVDMFSIYLFKM